MRNGYKGREEAKEFRLSSMNEKDRKVRERDLAEKKKC